MKKKALVIQYSHAGQTLQAVEQFVRGLGTELPFDMVKIEPTEDYPFPWTMTGFFRMFPRVVCGLAPRIQPLNIDWDHYDLVILTYQVWFLSPSLPVQGFLASSDAGGLNGKPVITLVTCRNLWQSALVVVRDKLRNLCARHLGQITVCEKSPLWASFVTTPRWMLTGRKNAFWFFPAAGIEDSEFKILESYGQRVGASWRESEGQSVDASVFGSNLNRVSLFLMDRIGRRFFTLWAPLILRLAPSPGKWQDFLLICFRLSLIVLILVVAPSTKIVEVLKAQKVGA